MQLIRLLPFLFLLSFSYGLIRPQSYLDDLTVPVLLEYNLLDQNAPFQLQQTSVDGTTLGTPSSGTIAMGGNRDMGFLVLQKPPANEPSTQDFLCNNGAINGNLSPDVGAQFFYQLDGPVDRAVGSINSPSLGSGISFDFAQNGESGLYVNVTYDHTITITFSVYSGANPNNGNRMSYPLSIIYSGDETVRASYFIPYQSWIPSGSASLSTFRAASAFAFVVEGDLALDFEIGTFAPYANTISGRVFIDCNGDCFADTTDTAITFATPITVTANDLNDATQSQYSVSISAGANPIYTIGVFIPSPTTQIPNPTRTFRVCSGAPQGYLTTDITGCRNPANGINFAANNQNNCLDVSVDFLEEVVNVNFSIYRDPLITAPAGGTPECTTSNQSNISFSGTPTTNIHPSCPQTVTPSNGEPELLCGANSGSVRVTRTWRVTDSRDRSATSIQVVQITDTLAPTIIAAPNTGLPCTVRGNAIITAPGSASVGTVGFADACSSTVTVSLADSAGAPTTCYASIIRTWNVRDQCGNLSTSTQFITFFDNTPPTWASIPASRTVQCDRVNTVSSTSTANTGGNPSGPSDDCEPAVNLIQSGPFNSGPTGTACGQIYTRNWRLTDACGNAATATQLITVVDTAPPSFAVPGPVTFQCSQGSFTLPTPTDQCDANPTISTAFLAPSSGTCTDVRTLRYTAFDNCGNTSTADQTVTISDTENPQISGTDAVRPCGSSATTDPGYPIPSATDNCGSATVSLIDTSSATSTLPGTPSGCTRFSFTRTWQATDGCRTATFVQIVTVNDLVPPNIFPPNPSFFDCQLINSPSIEFPNTSVSGTATAIDGCSSVGNINASNWVNVPNPGGCFTSLRRTWTASDACGNTATAFQLGGFTDPNPPVLTNAGSLVNSFTAECNVTATTSIAPIWTDSCNQVNRVGPEERSSGTAFCNQIITRTWTATDCSGIPQVFTQTINVVDTRLPTLTAPDDTSVVCNGGPPNLGSPTVFDTCDTSLNSASASTSLGNSGGTPCNQQQTFIWRVSDFCGNVATAAQVVNIIDNSPPTPSLSGAPTSVPCTQTTDTALSGLPTASDNCGIVTRRLVTTASPIVVGTCPGAYTFTRSWEFSDGCNTVPFTQTVTALDTIPPTLSIGSGPNVECNRTAGNGFSTASVLASHSTAAASDPNCSGTATTYFVDTFVQRSTCNSAIVRTWTATDDCGNTATDSTTFNIVDTLDPVVTDVPTPRTLTCAPGSATNPGSGQVVSTATASDACDPAPTLTYFDSPNTSNACSYVITRSWYANDICGRVSLPVNQIFTLVDQDDPVVIVPAATTYPCTNTADSPRLSDVCGLSRGYSPSLLTASIVTTPCAIGSGGDQFVRTWTATDGCGNTASASQTFTAIDITGPTFNPPITFDTTDCSSPSALNPQSAVSGVPTNHLDNCHPVQTPFYTYSDSASAGDVCRRTVVRTWTSFDGCGNPGTATQLIVARDNQPPIFRPFLPSGTVPCDSTVPTSPSTSPSNPLFGIPPVFDNCQVVTPVFDDSVIEGCPRILRRTWTVADSCNPPNVQTQIITFTDNNRPSFSYFPPNVSIPCDQNAGTSTLPALVPGGTAGVPTAVDACDPAPSLTWQDSVLSTSCPTRAITRTWIARDNCANITTRDQVLTLQLVDPPTLNVPPDASLHCFESTLPTNPAVGTATASQQCNIAIASVTFFDTRSVDGCNVIITRTWVATDACGLRNSQPQSIVQGDIASPDWSIFPADVELTCDEDTSPLNTGIAIATDDCTFPVCDVTWDDHIEDLYDQYNTLGTCPSNKLITRTWTARDDCGNELVNTQAITVLINKSQGPCAKEPCEVEKCTPCECNIRTCECCTGPKSCTAVACRERVACTAVPCNTVNCIPCPPLTDIYPLPFCDDSVPCIPVIIPVFVDDDGVFQSGDTGDALGSEYWLLRADYWKDLAIERGVENARGLASNLAPVMAFVVLLISLPFTFYAFFFN